MKIRRTIAASAIVLATMGVSTANAATIYNALIDFSLSNPSGPWHYGFGDPATSNFTAMTSSGSNYFNISGLNYWEAAPEGFSVPVVIKNTTGSPINIGTPYVPTDALLIHPGPSSENSDVIVQFKAPSAGSYSYSGFYELLDQSPTGVFGQVFDGTTLKSSGTLISPGANSSSFGPGQSEPFNGTVFLNAGSTLSFAVNNDGNYTYDSTGFNATITAVPEPATWAMLLLGFFGVGLMMRGTRRQDAAAVA
jgi:hypothetical protein